MDFDHSLLPSNHRGHDTYAFVGCVVLFIVYMGSLLLGNRLLITILEVLLVLALLGLSAYLSFMSYSGKKRFAQFVNQYAAATCTFDEMIEQLPPCFASLKERTDFVSVNVRDGYVFPLSSAANCLIFVFEYIIREGKFTRSYQFTIAKVRQRRVLPHLFLEGKQVKGLYPYDNSQRLDLEGDFDDYFNLYVPDGEQVDALTIFTPDIMRVLVDAGRPYDVELVDDSIVLIASGDQYTREQLPLLLQFLNTLPTMLNSGSEAVDHIDLTAALGSNLKPRSMSVPFLALVLVIVAIVAIAGPVALRHQW